MRVKGRQFRFLIAVLASWTTFRVATTWSGAQDAPPVAAAVMPEHRRPSQSPRAATTAVLPPGSMTPPFPFARARAAARQQPASASDEMLAFVPPVGVGEQRPSAMPAGPSPTMAEQVAAPDRSANRWTVSSYLFVRPGSGRPSLAGGGALGGSQAAVRATYALDRHLALAARAYAPLQGRGAEVAGGIDYHPWLGRPLRLSVERRVGLDGAGRDAWSAYAAGGFYLEPATALVVDGYAQGGVVGARSRDLFADGGIRAGRKAMLGRSTLVAGAGLWGAAQPGASRVDAGPRLALSVPVNAHALSLAVEGRFRIAGQARPGSGAAMTVGVDF